MGLALPSTDFPVIKGTSGVLVLTEKEVKQFNIDPCIKCGRCVDVCPMYLVPNLLGSYMETGMVEKAERTGAMDCFECGCCTYICPAKRPLVQWIRMAKGEIAARRKK